MPTAVSLDTPTRVTLAATWKEIRYPAHARQLQITATAPLYLRWAGVVEGDALGTGYLLVPAGGTLIRYLPGCSATRPLKDAGSLYIAGTAADTCQIEVGS